MALPKKETQQEPLEKQLWSAADKLRKNIDAAEYKHVVLGLIFLKYISDSFESLFVRLQEGKGEFEGADPEDRDEYTAKNVFFVPQPARWNWLRDNAKKPEIGVLVDAAMDAIEKENSALRGVLPKVYARENLDPASLGALIDLVSGIALGDAKTRSADVLGHVFEYFLGEFALAEGKKGGQFYTPPTYMGRVTLSLCSRIFRYGIICGYIKSDPCRDLVKALPAHRHKPMAALVEPKDIARRSVPLTGMTATSVRSAL